MPAELLDKRRAREESRADRTPKPERVARRELRQKIHFLLQEPQLETETEAQAEVERIAATAYPNPAINTTTLSFELESATVIRIDLRDEQGALVKNITRGSYEAGKNQLQIDLGDLQNGTYYLTLNSRAFAAPQSVKVLVVK